MKTAIIPTIILTAIASSASAKNITVTSSQCTVDTQNKKVLCYDLGACTQVKQAFEGSKIAKIKVKSSEDAPSTDVTIMQNDPNSCAFSITS